MDFLKQLFNRTGLLPLQRNSDIEFEEIYQYKLIANKGFEVISTIEKPEEILIIYRHFYEDVPKQEEKSIIIGIRVITNEGIHHPDPILKAFFNEEFTNISLADIEIEEPLANHGYGSILLSNLIKIAEANDVNSITGWISKVDSGHLERLVHFYKKHNFKVNLEENNKDSYKIGVLKWQNI